MIATAVGYLAIVFAWVAINVLHGLFWLSLVVTLILAVIVLDLAMKARAIIRKPNGLVP